MKTKTVFLFFLFATVTMHAQVSKTVNCTAGALATLLTSTEKATVTNLTLTGTIDSRDFPTMKSMQLLAVIDMSAVTIAAYNGLGAYRIADYAFKDNKKLESVLLPSSVTSIGGAAFGGCSSLTSVLFPTSVTSINNSAFYGCSGLTSITIPSSVTSIADHTFSDCSGLTSVSISTSATTIGAYAFSRCSGLTSVSIPSSVTFISISAFWGCSGLTSVSIPNSVQMIGDGAFSSCNKLTSLTTFAKAPLNISSSVFTNVNKTTCTIYVPAGSKALYQAAPVWKDFINIVEMTEVSVQSQALENVKIYPNPVVENFKISGLIGSSEITIINTNGQVVLRQNVFDNQPIAAGALHNGTYFVKARSNKSTTVIKFLKM